MTPRITTNMFDEMKNVIPDMAYSSEGLLEAIMLNEHIVAFGNALCLHFKSYIDNKKI